MIQFVNISQDIMKVKQKIQIKTTQNISNNGT